MTQVEQELTTLYFFNSFRQNFNLNLNFDLIHILCINYIWYKSLSDVFYYVSNSFHKHGLKFIQFDICDYYGSISDNLFREAIDWARRVTLVSDDEVDILFQTKKSLLFDGKDTWKKRGNSDFNIGMGSWDGAESTDLVGLFLLNKLKNLHADICLYRDDGLLVTRGTARQNEKLKQELIKIFQKYGLKLEVDANHTKVNFLDITLDLMTGLYTPYKKDNNTIHYIDTKSNHPPTVRLTSDTTSPYSTPV